MDPPDILREADKARGNLGGVSWRIEMLAAEGRRTNTMSCTVKARGFDVLVEMLAPPKRKGNKLLMLDGNMWFYKPDLSKPAPISQRQKLMGNAAYGDIATTNYAEDYDATLLREESVDGETCYLFDLKARSKKVTYDGILYWVSKERLVGVKADYYTVSGKKFKSAVMTYDNEVRGEDGESLSFVSRIIIRDEMGSSDSTTMSFSNPVLEEIPHSVFDLNLLMR
ncbi:MAG: outer membrane lipoprotein-sorting protein [Lentisphaerae bacterium]|nr:outer membrane lipoprotein-sorting protein [Lentisphaerota bacterium]